MTISPPWLAIAVLTNHIIGTPLATLLLNTLMKWIFNILIIAVAVFGLSKLLTPHISIVTFETAIIFSFVLAILNILVKPLIILLTLPLTIITLGLFLLVVNVIIILLADKFVSGIRIDGFLWAFIFGLLLTLVSTVVNKLQKKWSL